MQISCQMDLRLGKNMKTSRKYMKNMNFQRIQSEKRKSAPGADYADTGAIRSSDLVASDQGWGESLHPP